MMLSYRQDPSNLHWITDDNGSTCICEYFPTEDKLEMLKASYKNALELIIIADDELTAQNVDWFISHSASPMYGKKFYTDVRENTSHINSIYAFLCAYTIIEELGLDIRSSAKNPRFISGTYKWNSVVLNDIVKRLNDVGISEDDTITWLIRGEPCPLYGEIKPQFTNKAECYNHYNDVFDLKLKIYEAIHYCSYIRNYFIAHKTNDIVNYINLYDIHNMQNLARRLILSTLGAWDIMLDKVIKID